MAEHLEAIELGQIQNILFNVPPGHQKSLTVAVFWPAWRWATRPDLRWLFSSYSSSLSIRDSVRCRRIIESDWYQERWGHVYQLTDDQNQKVRFENDKTGVRIATSVEGTGTGERVQRIVADDPHNLKHIHSDRVRQEAINWWDQVMHNRVHDPKAGVRVIVMQRGHEADLAGHVLKQAGWDYLVLPAEYEPTRRVTSIGWKDPRTRSGEPLWPEMFGANGEEYRKLKAENGGPLDAYSFAAQYQQRPAPAAGGIWKTRHWRFWFHRDNPLPPVKIDLDNGESITCQVGALPLYFDEQLQSWDMTYKGLETAKGEPDYVVGETWGRAAANCYLLDQVRGQWEFTETLREFVAFCEKWPDTEAKLVEAAANGPAILSTLHDHIQGLVPIDPDGSKPARARAVTHMIEGGNVYLPHPSIAPWVWGFILECSKFPNGENDDQVDAASQALRRLKAQPTEDPTLVPYIGPRLLTSRGPYG